MPPNQPVMPFLHKRAGTWYFRFPIPVRLRPFAGRSEVRVSLQTAVVAVARDRAAVALAFVYDLKRLSRRAMHLTKEDVTRLVNAATGRLVDAIERSRELPRLSPPTGLDASPGINESILARDAFGFTPDLMPDKLYEGYSKALAVSVQRGDHEKGASLARHVLSTSGVTADEESQLFKDLSLQMLRLNLALRQVADARSRGDYDGESRILDFYRRSALPGAGARIESKPGAGVKVSNAWAEYVSEKADTQPNPDWSPRTKEFQVATFNEFKEIVGDVTFDRIDRDMMLKYRNTLAKLPANRQKRYKGVSAAELLKMKIPDEQLPSSRTVHEKLVRIAAFLKWCRETKGYLTQDVMARVQVTVESKSYSPFTKTDLEALFINDAYTKGEHRKSWRFWVPLIALYSGARQSEIAQLALKDISQVDGVWVFAITDEGEDQKVKTKAGIRKVPIHSKLIELGFLQYVEALKRKGEKQLFPDLEKGKHGWGDKVSRWFSDTYSPNSGIKADPTGGRKVFHSFRHTAITAALSKGQPLAHCQQVFGHEKSLLGETATYMGAFPVDTLVPVIESLDYGLDHSAYKDGWRKFADGGKHGR